MLALRTSRIPAFLNSVHCAFASLLSTFDKRGLTDRLFWNIGFGRVRRHTDSTGKLQGKTCSGSPGKKAMIFLRGIHGHSHGDQARRKKTRKTVKEAESPTKRCTSSCESIGRLCGPRSCRREEARLVGCWQSSDCEGGEEAVGEG